MPEKSDPAPHVYVAIGAVQSDLAQIGIAKDRKNQQQQYNFRSIDDIYNTLATLLAKHSLLILPRALTRTATERATNKGGVLFSVVVDMEFDFTSAVDGSQHTIRTIGEAMDSGDKATNKAMSAAYKYACMQAFCIPTEGDNDADTSTPPPIKPASQRSEPRSTAPPAAAPGPSAQAESASVVKAWQNKAAKLKTAAEFNAFLKELPKALAAPEKKLIWDDLVVRSAAAGRVWNAKTKTFS